MKRENDYFLRQAIAEGCIVPVFQPVMDMATGKVTGAEVLARWTLANGKSVPPDIFIPQSIKCGLIVSLTLKMIISVKTLLINCVLPAGSVLTIGFNAERDCLESTVFLNACFDFIDSLSGKGISLAVEITEREPVSDLSLKGLELLRRAGATIVLDDFGTGYATLDAIEVIKPDIVKLDRSLTMLANKEDAHNFLSGCIDEIHSYTGMRILAEGVETLCEQKWFYDYGVYLMQGWLYGKPQSWEKLFSELMSKNEK